jgi:methionyl-tRNA formyltransferase
VVIRVVFLGTPDFAVPTLRRLLEHPEIEVAAVITQPDRPAGRGRRLTPPPVKLVAEAAGVPVWQFERIRRQPEATELLRSLHTEVGVVVAFGQILPREFFEVPHLGMLNVHASVLPKFRGAAPIVHAILEGEEETGISIMRIDAGMDTGDVLGIRRIPLPDTMTADELESILSEDGASLLLDCLFPYVSGRLEPVPQNHSLATLAPMIGRDTARIDWSRPARRIHNQIRALDPAPGAYCLWRNQEIKLWRSSPEHDPQPFGSPRAAPGTVISTEGGTISVVAGDGLLLSLTELQSPGRKRLKARDFVNGLPIAAGDILG